MAESKLVHYLISGYTECKFFQKAQRVGKAYAEKFPEDVAIKVNDMTYEEFHPFREKLLAKLGKPADFHKTCPIVVTYKVENGEDVPVSFVGGCDSTVALLSEKYGMLPEAAGPGWK